MSPDTSGYRDAQCKELMLAQNTAIPPEIRWQVGTKTTFKNPSPSNPALLSTGRVTITKVKGLEDNKIFKLLQEIKRRNFRSKMSPCAENYLKI